MAGNIPKHLQMNRHTLQTERIITLSYGGQQREGPKRISSEHQIKIVLPVPPSHLVDINEFQSRRTLSILILQVFCAGFSGDAVDVHFSSYDKDDKVIDCILIDSSVRCLISDKDGVDSQSQLLSFPSTVDVPGAAVAVIYSAVALMLQESFSL